MKKLLLSLMILQSFAVVSSLQAEDKIEIASCMIKKTHDLKAKYGSIVTYSHMKNKDIEYNETEGYIVIDRYRYPYSKKMLKAWKKCNK